MQCLSHFMHGSSPFGVPFSLIYASELQTFHMVHHSEMLRFFLYDQYFHEGILQEILTQVFFF